MLFGRNHSQVRTFVGELVLNWTNEVEVLAESPCLSELFVELEQGAVEFNESLFDDWDVFVFSQLYVHHGD